MNITRAEKEKIVADLAATLKNSKGVVFADYKGLTVKEFEELRKRVRAEGASIKVAKLTLMRRALAEAGITLPLDMTVPTAVAYSQEDEIAPAKILFKFAEETKKLNLLLGLLFGSPLSAVEVKNLAKLPGKQELRGQVVSVLVAPMRGLVTVMSGVQRSLLYALNSLAEKKGNAN